ncbi:transmembrane reductase CYB561D2 [Spodoptera frugiperda]|uniref:ascorbate ferrireductase (transmembrane) n=1 Tax=Spodoptera frugiperda TaxID=7108 RepID=A0A9R0CWJ1_SPOFR|nr:transmembrane reductase CYB561D2 [Spodoptera frugiperda]
MDLGGEDTSVAEMGPSDRKSETSRLVAPNPETSPSYLNILSNICGLVFLGIILYCCFKDDVTLFSFHPTLMTLGWMLFMTSAMHALTPGDLATGWMPIRLKSARHWILQVLAGTIILTGFIIIVTNKFINGANHFTSYHGKFGLASFIFLLMTMLGGLGALNSLKLKHYLPPIYTKLIHTSAGLLTFCLGITTILLGFFSNWWKKDNPQWLTILCFVLVLMSMIATTLRPILKIYIRLRERLDIQN